MSDVGKRLVDGKPFSNPARRVRNTPSTKEKYAVSPKMPSKVDGKRRPCQKGLYYCLRIDKALRVFFNSFT